MNQLLAPGVVLTEVLCASYVLLLHQPQRDYFPLRFLCLITVCYLSLILWLIPGNEFSNMMKYITIYLAGFSQYFSMYEIYSHRCSVLVAGWNDYATRNLLHYVFVQSPDFQFIFFASVSHSA